MAATCDAASNEAARSTTYAGRLEALRRWQELRFALQGRRDVVYPQASMAFNAIIYDAR